MSGNKGIPVRAVEQVQEILSRDNYNETVRSCLMEALDRTGGKADPIVKALGVFLLSKETRETLAANDPQAMLQALRALNFPI